MKILCLKFRYNTIAQIIEEAYLKHIIINIIQKKGDTRVKQNMKQKMQKGIKRIQNKRSKELCYQRWSYLQNELYAQFLEAQKQSFTNQFLRRSSKVFVKMSQLIPTKSINQCKSHHQKMVGKNLTLQNIIKKYGRKTNEVDKQVKQHKNENSYEIRAQPQLERPNHTNQEESNITNEYLDQLQVSKESNVRNEGNIFDVINLLTQHQMSANLLQDPFP